MDVLEKYSPVLRQYWLPILLGCVGLIFFVYGLIGYFAGHQAEPGSAGYKTISGSGGDKQDILFEAASTSRTGANSDPDTKQKDELSGKRITVDVEGAVQSPGVYTLPAGSRLQDALIAAGGMDDKADRNTVAKSINLASKLIDGAKVYIPVVGEEIANSGTSQVLGVDINRPVDINNASLSELDALPGVGKTTADKIIANRPYSSIDDLILKKVVNKKVFDEIRERVGVD